MMRESNRQGFQFRQEMRRIGFDWDIMEFSRRKKEKVSKKKWRQVVEMRKRRYDYLIHMADQGRELDAHNLFR
jgi:hypothetical protein